jgi:hypothetical protein
VPAECVGGQSWLVQSQPVLRRGIRRAKADPETSCSSALKPERIHPPRREIRHRPLAASLASLNILKRLGGNENTFGCPLIEVAPDGIMKTPSYIWLLALLMLGNVLPSESIGRIVRLDLSRNPGHLCQHLNFQDVSAFQQAATCATTSGDLRTQVSVYATAALTNSSRLELYRLMQPARGSD